MIIRPESCLMSNLLIPVCVLFARWYLEEGLQKNGTATVYGLRNQRN